MKLVEPSVEEIKIDDTIDMIAKVARNCYLSTPKEPDEAPFVSRLINNCHFAMVEHKALTFVVNKELYYEVLGKAQNGWHEGEEDVVPFIKYLLGTILAAYKDFEDRFEIIGEKLPALEMVRKATKNKIGKFSKQDIRELCPSLSISSIEGSLRTLVKEGELMRGGSGKATYYVRLM